LPILDKFWNDILYYRLKGIDCHPEFKHPKRVLDLTSQEDISPIKLTECLIED